MLHQAIESHRGYVFKTVGDQFCAAFATAPNAVAAALAAQRALQDCGLRIGGGSPATAISQSAILNPQVKVRMAIHTGTAHERDGDFFGPTLNRVARILVAAHGGQTLLSQTTAD